MKIFTLCIIAGLLAGCATPARYVCLTTWYPTGQMQTQAISGETGAQLLWGERHTAQVGPKCANLSDTDNRAAGAMLGAVVGMLVGTPAGQPVVGALVGAGAGTLDDVLSKDKPTTPSLTIRLNGELR